MVWNNSKPFSLVVHTGVTLNLGPQQLRIARSSPPCLPKGSDGIDPAFLLAYHSRSEVVDGLVQ